MRWLGMTAAVAVIAAAVLNILWFARHGLGFGDFIAVTWPAGVGAVIFMAFTILLGVVTVRLLLQRDKERDAAEKEDAAPAVRGDAGPRR